MRLKILVFGNDPVSLVADCQLLHEKGLLVFTAFNMQNVNELVKEIKPDLVFFDAHKQTKDITDAYNEFVNGIEYTNIPVIYTLSDDDIYLITRKRTASKEKRDIISDSIVGAIRMALRSNKTYQKKSYGFNHIPLPFPVITARA